MKKFNQNSGSRLKPYYIFGTVALATLLLLLALMHPRGNQFVAESRVQIDDTVAASKDIETRDHLLRVQCCSKPILEAALANIEETVKADAGLGGIPNTNLAELVGNKLDVQVARDGETGAETVQIRYASKSQPFAVNLVQEIAEQLAQNYSEHDANPESFVSIRESEQRIASLRDQLTNRRDQQLEMIESGVVSLREEYESSQANSHPFPELEPSGFGSMATGSKPALEPPSRAADNYIASRSPDQTPRASKNRQLPPTDASPILEGPFAGVESAPEQNTETLADSNWPLAAPEPATIQPETPQPVVTPQVASAEIPRSLAGMEPTSSSRKLPKVYELNPRWSAVNNALSRARGELERLLEKMTPLHPNIVDLEAEIRKLEQLMKTTPQYLQSSLGQPNPTLTPIPESPQGDASDYQQEFPSPQRRQWESARGSVFKISPESESTASIRASFSAAVPSPSLPMLSATPIHSTTATRIASPGTSAQAIVSKETASPAQMVMPASFSEGAAKRQIANSYEYRQLGDKIDQLKSQLASEINRRNSIDSNASGGTAVVTGQSELIDSRCPAVSPFDLLTLFLPAGILAMIASVARKPSEPPAVLHSVNDAKKTLKTNILGTISTKNGPVIPTAAMGGPPKIVQWLVLASEVICIVTAVLVLISVFQIPGYTRQFLANPFSAFVTSFDFVTQFIRHT